LLEIEFLNLILVEQEKGRRPTVVFVIRIVVLPANVK